MVLELDLITNNEQLRIDSVLSCLDYHLLEQMNNFIIDFNTIQIKQTSIWISTCTHQISVFLKLIIL